MRPKRFARFAAPLLAVPALAVLVLSEPAAAQDSINEALIDGLNAKLLYVAIPIAILVELILLYAVIEFKDNDDPKPTQENRRLEITWTVATAVILLFVGFASYQVLAVPAIAFTDAESPGGGGQAAVTTNNSGAIAPPADSNALEVEVVAEKYLWTFNYPTHNVSSTGTLVIPTNRTIYLHIISKDWLHAFHVPDLALKQDAFPGQYNTIQTEVYETGTYQLYCAEYCGVGHSNMLGTVEVRSQQGFQQWLQEQRASGGGGNQSAGGNQTGGAGGNQTGGNQTGGNQTGGNATQSAVSAPRSGSAA